LLYVILMPLLRRAMRKQTMQPPNAPV